MYSTLNKLTRSSMNGYIDREDEAGKILDNVMKYKMRELLPTWKDDTGKDTYLTLIKLLHDCKEDNTEADKLLGYMNLADRAMEKSMKILPWTKLLSAVTLDTLFDVYTDRSTQDIDHCKELKKLKRLIENCTDLQVDDTTTVGKVLEKVRIEKNRAWVPSDSIKRYTSKIRDCYRIIQAILYEGPADIYDVKNLCENNLGEVNDTDRCELSKEIV